jgi:hypothetical protein
MSFRALDAMTNVPDAVMNVAKRHSVPAFIVAYGAALDLRVNVAPSATYKFVAVPNKHSGEPLSKKVESAENTRAGNVTGNRWLVAIEKSGAYPRSVGMKLLASAITPGVVGSASGIHASG